MENVEGGVSTLDIDRDGGQSIWGTPGMLKKKSKQMLKQGCKNLKCIDMLALPGWDSVTYLRG